MPYATFDHVNDYEAIAIALASPEEIRSWSYGEVKKPETINYRTYRAEKDGLFCERIFGPERNWECFCGKYKGIKYSDIVCERCGVKVTHSRVRRERMGHINLAAPVAHIWFFKSLPSRMGTLLDMKTTSLEKVVYFQEHVVIDPGSTPLKEKQLLTEEEHRAAVEKYGVKAFESGTGAEAIQKLLKKMDMTKLIGELRVDLRETASKQKAKKIVSRLKLIESMRESNIRPDWMVLDVIPVIPTDLRPLVPLESGNFATSDLNDLYRRVINRNNRLKKLIDLNAPEIIIRNEKRILQQSVDALLDNGRCKRPVFGTSNRPLKSLTDMIKGKQGRFRENLLGKRVDYSARSVIVVGPELRLDQCGLPKKIALELYQPFLIRRLKELGYADTIKGAKRLLEKNEEEIWDILDEVIKRHPVLLNRAPTLHRMGIQAFYPVLVEGNAIRIHPLVCGGYNADFDGDQMAVHLPLSTEAVVEAITLMLSSNNVFSPASGDPIISPSQDIVLGCYYVTAEVEGQKGEGKKFSDRDEVLLAMDAGVITLHAKVGVRLGADRKVFEKENKVVASDNGFFTTTPGRIIFNDILPEGMAYYNFVMTKKALQGVISDCHKVLGREKTIRLLDLIKETGFKWSTLAGLTFSTEDLKVPTTKNKIIDKTEIEVKKIESAYKNGVITEGERYNQVVDSWTHATNLVAEELIRALRDDTRGGKTYLNPIFLMTNSGARGSVDQIKQLAGMRGLMAKPSGQIIETPIKANFREGLRCLEYFSSTHGARKGLADTALKTADSGYLTRKLADVAQDVIVTEDDCGTMNGISKGAVYKGEHVHVSLSKNISGRTARDNIVDLVTDRVVVKENESITEDAARQIEALGYEKIRVRSPLTCETAEGICAKCYGLDLSMGRLVEMGTAVGIIGAQSIGEPGTQLTMRTFHIGGTARRAVEESEIACKQGGTIRYIDLHAVINRQGETVVLNRGGELAVLDAKGRELEKYEIPVGAVLKAADGATVTARKILAKWDPHMVPIITEVAGRVRFEDIILEETMREEKDPATGHIRRVIMEHKGDHHPQIVIEGENGKVLGIYAIPERAHIEVDEGKKLAPGTMLAKTPREITRTQDITGGLPRVTELLEARVPKEPAVISEIDGVVELGERRRGKRTIIVKSESGMKVEHLVPHGKYLRVHHGDHMKAGEPLVDGALVPHDILRICGEEEVQQYLLREIQSVYLSQGVRIDDKHIEIIVSKMMEKVRVEDSGDTDFLPGSLVERHKFKAVNDVVRKARKKPATAKPTLLGVTKAALQSESFLSAASFQDTTKVLTEAALTGRRDTLRGLKENVILGHRIPAGTGHRQYLHTKLERKEVPAPVKVETEVAEEEVKEKVKTA
ncbi:MAG: DNA-directed RNA polymerase subunit beta' [Planctomycetota bacterium]